MNGKLLYLQHPGKYALGSNTMKIDVSGRHLAEGIYLVKLNVNGTTVKTDKLIKVR